MSRCPGQRARASRWLRRPRGAVHGVRRRAPDPHAVADRHSSGQEIPGASPSSHRNSLRTTKQAVPTHNF